MAMNVEGLVTRWRLGLLRKSQQIKLVRELASIMKVKKYQLVIVVLLSLLVATLDAVGLGLLVPLAQGVVRGDFTAVELPTGLDQLVAWLLASSQLDASPATLFFILASVIFAANFLGVAFGFINTVYGQYLQGLYQWHLNTSVYVRYFSLGKLFFDKTSQGSIKKVLEYTARIVTLVRVLQNNLANFTRLIAHIVLLVWLSWQLLLLVLLVFPVLYVLSRFVMGVVNRLWSQAKDITLELGQESFNMLSALPLVWSYSQEGEAKQKYAAMNEQFRRVQLKAQVLGDFTITIPRTMTLLALFAVVVFISLAIQREQDIDLVRMLIFLYVASRTVPLFKLFNTVWVVISEMSPPILEVLQLFRDEGKHIVVGGKRELTGLRQGLDFRQLTFAYEGRDPVLRGVSFTVPQGQLTALVGPSGSGKSTIISLLMRFYDCPPGTIFLDGVDIREFTMKSLRRHIAVVDQEPILLHETLRNNIAYGREEASDEQVADVVTKTHLNSLVRRLPEGLETKVGDRGVQLSGGEKQRVAISRALLKGSEIVLLDEATSALDSTTEQYIQEALAEVIRGKTALVVAHRLSTVQSADKIVYLENGRVLEQGTLNELLERKGAFAGQWQAQMFS